MEFTKGEYNKDLGCYLKWVHGSRDQVVEKMYSISAFHFFTSGYIKASYNKYAEYLEQSVVSIMNNEPEWAVRVYTDPSIYSANNPDNKLWMQVLAELIKYDRVQIVCIKMPRYFDDEVGCHSGLLPVMFRYLTLFDPNVGVCLFRDIDNIWTEQHQYFINKWLAGGEDICLFLNQDYKRQQAEGLYRDGVMLESKYYNTILSGLWSIRKPIGAQFNPSLWWRIFAYIESYTDFVNLPEYKDYQLYGVRFIYGFDELALTRVLMPIFINMGLTFYAIPIKIYDVDYFNNLFDEPALGKFLKYLTYGADLSTIKSITINNYWHMGGANAGLSQYMLCILTSIYFNLIIGKSKYKNGVLINTLRDRVYPVPLLMSLGIFTFKNYKKYNWFPLEGKSQSGSGIVNNFLKENKKITLDEFAAGSDLNISEDEDHQNPYNI
jgi:hypothetical protein